MAMSAEQTTCPLAELCLTRAQEKALAEMRLMERIGKGGGIIKLFWDGKSWRVTAIRSARGREGRWDQPGRLHGINWKPNSRAERKVGLAA